jgi:hypothetical protein
VLDPLADRRLGQVQLSVDLADHLAGGTDQLDDFSFSLVLRREEPAWSWHLESHLEGRAPILGVHQAGATPHSTRRARHGRRITCPMGATPARFPPSAGRDR